MIVARISCFVMWLKVSTGQLSRPASIFRLNIYEVVVGRGDLLERSEMVGARAKRRRRVFARFKSQVWVQPSVSRGRDLAGMRNTHTDASQEKATQGFLQESKTFTLSSVTT